jgi:hypothetical protein
MAAFGESCRDSGHCLTARFDPQRTRPHCRSEISIDHLVGAYRIDCGTARPSVLAVWRLTTIQFCRQLNGQPDGFAPRRIDISGGATKEVYYVDSIGEQSAVSDKDELL